MPAPQRPRWIDTREALAIHERQLAEHGGISGIRDTALLESALSRPANIFSYERKDSGMARLAAIYAHGLIANHPFLDGNKRTALVVARTFLRLNGYDVVAEPADKYRMIMAPASGDSDERVAIDWFRSRLRKD